MSNSKMASGWLFKGGGSRSKEETKRDVRAVEIEVQGKVEIQNVQAQSEDVAGRKRPI